MMLKKNQETLIPGKQKFLLSKLFDLQSLFDNKYYSITKRTPHLMAFIFFTLTNLTGCIIGPGYGIFAQNSEPIDSKLLTYKLYPGKERSNDEIVTLDLGTVDSIIIDGLIVNRPDYEKVLLLPGYHSITLSETFTFSVMVEPSIWRTAEGYIKVKLDAGRTYKLYAERTHGAGYRIYFWIEDLDSGNVVGGFKKP